jgi:hypothetical protein
MFYCSLLLYGYGFVLISLYQTLSLKLIAHFVGMHVVMDQRTIVETQTIINALNEVV